jgi:hypothetical protein
MAHSLADSLVQQIITLDRNEIKHVAQALVDHLGLTRPAKEAVFIATPVPSGTATNLKHSWENIQAVLKAMTRTDCHGFVSCFALSIVFCPNSPLTAPRQALIWHDRMSCTQDRPDGPLIRDPGFFLYASDASIAITNKSTAQGTQRIAMEIERPGPIAISTDYLRRDDYANAFPARAKEPRKRDFKAINECLFPKHLYVNGKRPAPLRTPFQPVCTWAVSPNAAIGQHKIHPSNTTLLAACQHQAQTIAVMHVALPAVEAVAAKAVVLEPAPPPPTAFAVAELPLDPLLSADPLMAFIDDLFT